MNIKRENLRTMKENNPNTCKIPMRCSGKNEVIRDVVEIKYRMEELS